MKRIAFVWLMFMCVVALYGTAAVYTGTCGAEGHDLDWELNTEDSVLVISGTGTVMADYNYLSSPWIGKASCIKRVELPAALCHIGAAAFSGCYALTSVTLPGSLQSIGDYAFEQTSITSVVLPPSLSQLGTFAFASSKLQSITIPEGIANLSEAVFFACHSLTEAILPSTLTAIGADAFSDCPKLKDICLPDGLQTIGQNAFSGDTSLVTLILPAGLRVIGDNAFAGCGLTSVQLPAGLEQFGMSVFRGCMMEAVVIPDGMTVLPYATFANCRQLTEVTLPETLKEIDEIAFADCESLQAITLPSSLQSIGASAFVHCSSLTDVVIPSQVTMIGNQAFGRCTGLKTLTSLATTPPTLGENVGERNNAPDNMMDMAMLYDVTLTVPDGSLDQYLNERGWKEFAHINGNTLREDALHGTVELSKTRAQSETPITTPDINVSLEGDSLHVKGYLSLPVMMSRYMYYAYNQGTLTLSAYALQDASGYAANGYEPVMIDFKIGLADTELATLDVNVTAPRNVKQNFVVNFTSIHSVEDTDSSSPVFYDLQGRPTSHPTPGIYIQNGRKVLVR